MNASASARFIDEMFVTCRLHSEQNRVRLSPGMRSRSTGHGVLMLSWLSEKSARGMWASLRVGATDHQGRDGLERFIGFTVQIPARSTPKFDVGIPRCNWRAERKF